MTSLEALVAMKEKNLSVGTWTDQKGNKYVSLTRMGKYNKNIAIPVELVDTVVFALASQKEAME